MILPNSHSFTRTILDDRINFEISKSEHVTTRKRSAKKDTQDKARKKTKTSDSRNKTLEEENDEEDSCLSDASQEETSMPPSRVSRHTVFRVLSSFASTSANAVDKLQGANL